MIDELRLTLETISLILGLLMVVLAIDLARRVRNWDESTMATRLFLRATLLQRVLVLLAVAVVLFVLMPLSVLGFLLTNVEILDVIHDVSHLLFVSLMLMGLWWLRKLRAAREA